MNSSPYANAPAESLAEIIREAEDRLQAQLTVGLAADQRAMTLAGFLAAIDAVIITAMSLRPLDGFLLPLVVMATGFFLAAAAAIWSASPIAWDLPGNAPCQWLGDIRRGATLHDGMIDMAGHYDEMIAQNEERLATNANWIRIALTIVFVTPLLSAASLMFA